MKKSKGNMFEFITHTFNPIVGKCPHECIYCYMKRFIQLPLRLKKNALVQNLGSGKKIFVCSGTDLFAKEVPTEWIAAVLYHLKLFDNEYLLQSKNALRMIYFMDDVPEQTIFSTTLESNLNYPEIMGNSPSIEMRQVGMKMLKNKGKRIMITIEPILDFDLLDFSSYLISLKPEQINIGADSRGHKLPEPHSDKIKKLIENLERKNIKVHIKKNLNRILKQPGSLYYTFSMPEWKRDRRK